MRKLYNNRFDHWSKTLLSFAFLFIFGSKVHSQGAYITGATQPSLNATETYEATFDYGPFSYTNITWYVTGGIIIDQNVNPTISPIYCIVVWNTPGSGQISVAEDIGGQSGTLFVEVGYSPPQVTPSFQLVNYGSNPTSICTDGGYSSYQWQESTDGSTWNNISGATSHCYSPSAAVQTKYYQCIVDVGVSVTTNVATVQISSLDAGTIFASSQQPNYNTSVTITNNPASGGFCYSTNYQYEWEQSIDGGPWTMIGAGQNFPGSNLQAIGQLQIRRKITCDLQSLYSNVLSINTVYTAVDFENRNYVRENVVLKKGIQSWAQADNLPIGEKLQSTTYLDGIGRPIQAVEKEVSPVPTNPNIWFDLVKHYEYDAGGRTIKDFIPFPSSDYLGKYKPNAAAVQPSVTAFFDNETQSSPAYTSVELDNSPLNRVLKTIAPGASWVNTGVAVAYDFNQATESIQAWSLDYNNTALPIATHVYGTGVLLKTVSTDERGKKVIIYTDLTGALILKKVQEKEVGQGLSDLYAGWACTYYIYDDFGQLRYIISPKAVEYLDNNGWPPITQTLIDELCFKYLYDEKGRTVIVKKPAAGEEKMIYDKKDRLVLTQHANQDKANNTALTKNQWSFLLYDDFNRTVATGLINNDASQSTLKNYIDNGSYLLPSQTISAFAGSGYISIVADYPVAGSSGSTNYLPGTDNSIVFNSIVHYDDYTYTGVKSFNTNYSFAYTPGSNNTIEPTVKTERTRGFVTGEKLRVLDGDNNLFNDVFLFSTVYYDEKGGPIQTLSDNIKEGLDYQTHQYDFAGRLMSSHTNHSNNSETHTIISKNEYDKIGRLTKFSKNFNNSFYKILAEYVYDELGRVKTKRIAPGYTGISGKTEMESLSYNYNIQGSVTGINKEYALSDNNYAQWDKFFGVYFTYSNHTTPQWNGNISSVTWKSQGDNTPRKFEFEYDNLDRFKNAIYKQKNKPADATWSNSEVDFSTYVEYEDGNGNIKTMKHMGIIPGVNNGVVVDDLRYYYLPTGIANLNGNKLKQVDDLGSLGSNNGLLGDFKDAVTSQDYNYDVNGNLVKDINKAIKNGSANGVIYNYMNKPDKIVIEGKSTIYFTYDAAGEKLKKLVEYADGSKRINTYIVGFIYEQFIPVGGGGQGDLLQFVLHEEGRIKIITAVSNTSVELNAGTSGITNWPGSKQGVFEYFIKDHLGNTRLVLTEEVQKEFYRATVERTAAITEEPLFGKVNDNGVIPNDNELKATRYLNNGASPWPAKTDDYTRLTAAELGKDIGPNLILKVMAGDIISSNVDYYYSNNSGSPAGYNPTTGIVTSLVGALTSNKATTLGKNQHSAINSNLTSNTLFQNFTQGASGSSPKAFLNIVFFDEQFKFIDRDLVTTDVSSGFVQVSSANNPSANMVLQKKAPKNGWVFVYLSNESEETVYFDNFYTSIDHGRISEENHYYPFGLKIGALSSKAFNKLDSKYEYQGDYSEAEEETGWDGFDLRMYDPQIGRWTGVDPYNQFASPYVAMGNNPIIKIDENGGWTWTAGTVGSLVGTAIGLTAAYFILKNNPNMDEWKRIAIAVGLPLLGAGVGYASTESIWTADINQVGPNQSRNFFRNFGAFYAELFTLGYKKDRPLGVDRKGNYVWPPDIWDKLRLKVEFRRVLPKLNYFKNFWFLDEKERTPLGSILHFYWDFFRILFVQGIPPYPWLTLPFPFASFPITYWILREVIRIPIFKKRP